MSASMGSETADFREESSAQVKSNRRSKVWEHYVEKGAGVDLKAVCKYCKGELLAKFGTSSLRSHLTHSCRSIEDDVRKKLLLTMKKQPTQDFVFDPKLCRDLMTKFCIHAEISFLKFEDPYLQAWIDSMQPAFQIKGRHTVRDDAMKMYQEMKKEIEVEFENLDSRICLTSDMWTSNQNLGYMCITAHYIDAGFNYKKKIINFKEVRYPHTGFAIEEAVVSCLTEWGIRSKIFTLTLDNASNNTAACEEFIKYHKDELLLQGQNLHIQCCAHILNILVQDGMRIIHRAIDKIRELLKHIETSPSRFQDFNTIAIAMGLASKKGMCIDVANRWNSTWEMLVEALLYRSVLDSYASQHLQDCPIEEEWAQAKGICDFLKAFEELTRTVSAHRQSTSHQFLPVVLCIRHALKDPGWQTNEVLKELASVMQRKLDKYWDPNEKDVDHNRRRKSKEIELNPALVIATFLDPRRKGDYLDFFYSKVCNSNDQISNHVDTAIDMVKRYIREYELLATTDTACPTPSSQGGSSTIGSPIVGKRKLEEEFAQYRSRRRTTRVQRSELDAYLEEPCEVDTADFDVLSWWKRHVEKFPILSFMARDFLAIPLSTVASESAFSCGGRILGDTRSSLVPDMLQALVCGKDWLFIPKNDEGWGEH